MLTKDDDDFDHVDCNLDQITSKLIGQRVNEKEKEERKNKGERREKKQERIFEKEQISQHLSLISFVASLAFGL